MNWQQELRQQLDAVPGGAVRLLRAIDEGRIEPMSYGKNTACGTIGCAYGHIYGNRDAAIEAAMRSRNSAGYSVPESLEYALIERTPIRDEVVLWLAEHGPRALRVTQLQEQNQR